MMTHRFAPPFLMAACLSVGLVAGQAPKPAPAQVDTGPIRQADLTRWLTTLASDAMEGRANLTDSLVRAGDYLAAEARAVGLEPGGEDGTYFQSFHVSSGQSVNRSTLTVEVNGRTRVFRQGEGVEFPPHVGGRRVFTIDQVEFLGYGLQDPTIRHDDFAGKDVRGKAVVWLGARGPKGAARSTVAVNEYLRPAAAAQAGAAVVIGPSPAVIRAEITGRPAARGPQKTPGAFTMTGRLDDPTPPPLEVNIVDTQAFYSFLLGASGVAYADVQAKASARAPLPSLTLKGVTLTFNLDADYTVLRSSATRNVVGVLRGADPALADTYVVLGAHYDHLGAGLGSRAVDGLSTPAAAAKKPAGTAKAGAKTDRIFNGADDNGSGCAALLAIAKALVEAPRPRRTVVFVWFAGEERRLLGSQYHANHGLPADRIAAMLNIDMIGRNEGDRPEMADTVFIIGSDRISTELHNINEDTNASLPHPLTLDYQHNDPLDVRLHYYGSDHHSYALKGVPVIFFNTGRHPDYHRVTDSVDKIAFPKMARITHLAYETAQHLANLDHTPVRDNKGPRMGKGRTGKLPLAGQAPGASRAPRSLRMSTMTEADWDTHDRDAASTRP